MFKWMSVFFLHLFSSSLTIKLAWFWRPLSTHSQITGTSCIFQNERTVAFTTTLTVPSFWRGKVTHRHQESLHLEREDTRALARLFTQPVRSGPCVFHPLDATRLAGYTTQQSVRSSCQSQTAPAVGCRDGSLHDVFPRRLKQTFLDRVPPS